MRTKTDNLLNQLEEMRRYFIGCARSCQMGSAAYRKFNGYALTLSIMIEIVRGMPEVKHDD